MAVMALTAEYIAINSVDMSAYLKSAELGVDVAKLDTTSFASAGWSEAIGGLKDGELRLTFNDDFTNSTVDSRIWALLGTVTTFEVRSSSAAVGVNNPKFTGSVLVSAWQAGGKVGDLAEKSVTWPTSGAVTRATS